MRLFPLIPALLAAGPALADCDTAMTQTDMTLCAARAAEAADADLNAAYKRIAARLDDNPDARERLVRAQRAWIAFRDAECGFARSGVEGGSIAPMIEAQCIERLTSARAADLGAYLTCEEGDLSCPVPPG